MPDNANPFTWRQRQSGRVTHPEAVKTIREKTRDELLADAERALNDMDKGVANLRAIVDGWGKSNKEDSNDA